MTTPSAPETSMSERWHHVVELWRRRLWVLATALILLVAVLVVIGRELMSLVPSYRADVEQLLSERLQRQVSIQLLEGRMAGLSPVLELQGLKIEDNDGSVLPLYIGKAELSLDVIPTLINRQLRIRELLIEKVQLEVVRLEDGRITLRGLEALPVEEDPERKAENLKNILRLLYRQKKVLVNELKLTVSILDGHTLVFPDVEAALLNSGDQHVLSVRAQSGPESGSLAVDSRIHLFGDALTLSDVTAKSYLYVKGSALSPFLKDITKDTAVQLNRVAGAMEVWGEIEKGELVHSRIRSDAASLELSGKWFEKALTFDRVDLLADLIKQGDEYQFNFVQGEINAAPGLMKLPNIGVWFHKSGTSFARDKVYQASASETKHAIGSKWALSIQDLKFGDLHIWLSQLPIRWPEEHADKVRNTLDELSPDGVIESLQLMGEGSSVENFFTEFSDIYINPTGKLPGVAGLSGWAMGSLLAGAAYLDSHNFSLTLPALYEKPLAASIDGSIAWVKDEKGLQVDTAWLKLNNTNAKAKAVASIRLQPDMVPTLSLLGSLSEAKSELTASYIPLKRLPQGASDWLASAFLPGVVAEGRFLHEGPVKIDPSRQQDRVLEMAFRTEGMGLQFLPDWPALQNLSGDVFLDGREIKARVKTATLRGAQLLDVYADIPTYLPGEAPLLIVSGKVDAPSEDISHIFNETNLKGLLPEELENWHFEKGRVKGDVLLSWSLRKDSDGNAFLANTIVDQVDMVSKPYNLRFSQFSGPLYFHLDQGLYSEQLQGRFWDGDLGFSLGTNGDQITLLGNGSADVNPVMSWLSQSDRDYAAGIFNYQAQLKLPWKQAATVELKVDSSLEGAALNLPSPASKQPQQLWPMSMTASFHEKPLLRFEGEGATALIEVDSGSIASADVVIGSTLTPTLPDAGVRIRGSLPKMSIEPWIDWVEAQPDGQSSVTLSAIDLYVDQANIFDLLVDNSRLQLFPLGDDLSAWVESDQLVANVKIPDGFIFRGKSPLEVDVSHLIMSTSDAESQQLDPTQLPTADIKITGVQVDGEDMGQWHAQLRPLSDGIDILDLQGVWRHTRFNGEAIWSIHDDVQQTRFVGNVASGNLSAAAKAWDVPDIIESKKASANLDLEWDGSPFDLDYLATRGSATVAIRDALIPNRDSRTNALRMLGFFNINAISRRLRLDFSDVYKEGLSCDRIKGQFTVDGPKVSTSNLNIKSPSAEFDISGDINLDTEQLDQKVEVTLPTSSSLYLGCFAGPAACAGMFVVERLWGNKFEKMLTLNYSVSGSWSDPEVNVIEKK